MPDATSAIVFGSKDILATAHGVVGVGVNKAFLSLLPVPFAGINGSGFAGKYRVAGRTLNAGYPVSHQVYLFSQASMSLVRSTTTELPNAEFEFTGLAPGLYLVLGVDRSGTQNAVTYSHITAVL